MEILRFAPIALNTIMVVGSSPTLIDLTILPRSQRRLPSRSERNAEEFFTWKAWSLCLSIPSITNLIQTAFFFESPNRSRFKESSRYVRGDGRSWGAGSDWIWRAKTAHVGNPDLPISPPSYASSDAMSNQNHAAAVARVRIWLAGILRGRYYKQSTKVYFSRCLSDCSSRTSSKSNFRFLLPCGVTSAPSSIENLGVEGPDFSPILSLKSFCEVKRKSTSHPFLLYA